MEGEHRKKFATKLGAIMASSGSAIGLGNIWRFPYEAGSNGGFAFILVYLISVIFLCLPILLVEFYMGKHTQSGVAIAFERISGNKKWNAFSLIAILTSASLLCFYSVVAGWTLEYVWESITNSLSGRSAQELQENFDVLSRDASTQYFWTLLFLLITFGIAFGGVEKGIEKFSNIVMPLFIIIIIALSIYALSFSGAKEGLSFLFYPDFSKLNAEVILSAVGQAFLSLTLGQGVYITYASYFSKDTKLYSSAVSICALDTCVAIMSGIIIFPIVFSFGVSPEAGPHLVFITLPNIFNQLTGGYVFSALFFFLLSIAALTSLISIAELMVAFMHDKYGMKRPIAILISFSMGAILSLLCCLSQCEDSSLRCFGKSIFDISNEFVDYVYIFGGMLLSIFFGCKIDKQSFQEVITNNGKEQVWGLQLFSFLLKYIIPFLLLLLFCSSFL